MPGREDDTGTMDTLLASSGDRVVPAGVALPSRYEDLGRIGTGGMGEVHRVWDTKLRRSIAMKIIRPASGVSQSARRRFEAEARLTARLQHPAIVPVHDTGVLPDGRLWFTMREVRGVTLAVLMSRLHEASDGGTWTATDDGWSLRRLVSVWESVCLAVAYAHESGIVHRDLKPSNIMVGPFGEVQVMDWGIAKVLADAAEPGGIGCPALSGDTRFGMVMGTPAFMAPEQARGEVHLHGPASDIWALGAILYGILTNRAPYRGDSHDILRRVASTPPDPMDAGDAPAGPPELCEIVERTMRHDPAERPPTAGLLAEAARDWLDGSARRTRARSAILAVDALRSEAEAARAEAKHLREQAGDLLADVLPHDPVELKTPAWDLEERASTLEQEAALAETRYVQGVRGALELAPGLSEAHERLADHYRERLVAAERLDQTNEAVRYEELLRTHDRGRHQGWLAGRGCVTLVTDPPGAQVFAARLEHRHRRLVPGPEQDLGATPMREVPLDRGSWLLRLRHPERAEVCYPVVVGRSEHWDGVPPGGTAPLPIRLPTPGELGPDDCYVPAGWFAAGGDADAVDGLSARALWVDAFVLRRFPVTVEEYIAFLDGLTDAARADEAQAYVPVQGAGVSGDAHPVLAAGPDGRYQVGSLAWGAPLGPRMPIACVDWWSATAMAAWAADREGLPWRLAHDHEWEKAARGVDGRTFPWGYRLDPTWACMQLSHGGQPGPVPIDAYPDDVSVFGVRGLAGSMRDWCLNGYARRGPEPGARLATVTPAPDHPYRMVRGGLWSGTERLCRAASRVAAHPDTQMTGIGLRLARSYGP